MVRKALDSVYALLDSRKGLARMKPVVDAADGFFYGTPERTTSAPHILDNLDIKRFMFFVVIALMPSLLASVYFYGWRVIYLVAVSYIAGGACEVAFAVFRKKEIEEGFLITGLIFPLTLPPTVPWWIVVIGVMFGVIFGKEVFGGTGRNIFNPALAGRVFVTISFPRIMALSWFEPLTGGIAGFGRFAPDAVTSATPLAEFKSEQILASLRDLFFGLTPGSIGETFSLGIIIGGVFLILTKVANWRIPLAYLLSTAVFSSIGNAAWPGLFAPPGFQLLSGGLLFGAFFMATDPVTSPFTDTGRLAGGVILGFLTVIIRTFSGFVEGVMFAILLMNAFTPLIDHIIVERRYRPTGEKNGGKA